MPANKIKSMWQRSPEQFLLTHKSAAVFQIHFWKEENPNLQLHQFVGRYIDGLPADVPGHLVLEIIKIIIDVWENQGVRQKEAVAA